MKWPDVERIHSDAAADLVAAAERVPPEKWLIPRGEGKWSPAEVVEHLNLAYDVLLAELAGGKGLQVRTKFWLRMYLRLVYMPRLMRGGPFPEGVRAPRELRQPVANPDQSSAIAGFRDRAARMISGASAAIADGRKVLLTHPYFGKSPLPDGVLFCARHIQHHRKQI